MRPIRTSMLVVATIAAAGAIGLPLLGAGGDVPDPPGTDTTGVETSVGTSVETSVADSTTTVADATTTTALPPPVVVAAAGDLSCEAADPVTPTECHAGRISDALLALPDLHDFLALGDIQYRVGSLKEFRQSYDLSYGRLKDLTRPVPGNHEYGTRGAAGYFTYFGAAAGTPGAGWYSFDVGTDWHIVALNSNCGRVGCEAGSAQEQWLRADLAASDRPCTAAFWHHPLFSSGGHHGFDPRTAAFWQALQEDGAEIVLTGHDHDYERFAPQTADGTASDAGVRAFVVGTGGRSLHTFADAPAANSEVRLSSFGYLRLSLGHGGYDFDFVGEDATVLDSGSGSCHEPSAPPTPSTVPSSSTVPFPSTTLAA